MPEVYGNRYEVIERVGDGGMATVYRGIDRVLKRDVAIKVMHPHLASRNDARARFNREAQAIARLHHGNIVDVYDFSVGTDEAAFLVTEFVHGETLSQFVNSHGPFLPQAAALIGHAVAAALAHAHTVGIVHRDIKPDNLMISRDGQIKLMDFGIATALDLEQMTATGAIVGSPAHMAPEQIEGSPLLDHRCDIFAFGTVLYFLVTRKLPFVASNPHALFRQILEGRFEAASRHNPQVDRAFDAIIAQCLARQPADRWPNMTALQNALTAYLKQFRMSDVSTLLPRFLKAPEVFQFDLKPTLVRAMTAEGRRQAEAGQLALAIDSFNRALVMAPDADEPKRGLHELMTRQRRRKHMRRWLTVSGTVTATGLATWLVVALVREPPEPVRAKAAAHPLKLSMLPAPPRYVKQAVAIVPPVVPPAVVALPALVTPTTPTPVVEVRPIPPIRRTWPRWEPREHVTPQPDTVQAPVVPVHKQIVQFGADPTSAILKLRRQGEAKADEIGQGAGVRRELEDGAWALICEYPTAACPACTPAQLVKVRPFVLPLRYQAPIKCEKPTAE